jgi:uncharacterized protein (TIGR02271 family)
MENSTFGPVLDWNEIIMKEARSLDDVKLGKIQEINETSFVIEKGTKNKEKFYIPRSFPHAYNGSVILFDITEDEAKKKFMTDTSMQTPSTEESKALPREENGETIIPLTEERLEVSKKEIMEEATVIKESIKETKTVEVQLTHEELIIEKRKPSSRSSDTTTKSSSPTSEEGEQKQIQSKTEITIPLKKEEVVVTKKPYVKEEIVIKKKQVTETKTVSEDVISEKVSDSDRGISRDEIKETDGDQ